MTTRDLIMAASGAAEEKLYADDVFGSFAAGSANVQRFLPNTDNRFSTNKLSIVGGPKLIGTSQWSSFMVEQSDTASNSGIVYVYDIKTDSAGNIYVCGASFYTPGNGRRACLIKLNSSGVFQWQVGLITGVTSQWSSVYDRLVINSSDEIYVAGQQVSGLRTGLVVDKYNASGTRLSTYAVTSFTDNSLVGITDILVTSDGSVIVTTTYETDALTSRSPNIFKFNSSLSLLWHKNIVVTSRTPWGCGRSAVDSAGNVYVAHYTDNISGYLSATLSKISSDGTTISVVNSFDSPPYYLYGVDVAIDASDNVYFLVARNNRIWLIKMNTSGTIDTAGSRQFQAVISSVVPTSDFVSVPLADSYVRLQLLEGDFYISYVRGIIRVNSSGTIVDQKFIVPVGDLSSIKNPLAVTVRNSTVYVSVHGYIGTQSGNSFTHSFITSYNKNATINGMTHLMVSSDEMWFATSGVPELTSNIPSVSLAGGFTKSAITANTGTFGTYLISTATQPAVSTTKKDFLAILRSRLSSGSIYGTRFYDSTRKSSDLSFYNLATDSNGAEGVPYPYSGQTLLRLPNGLYDRSEHTLSFIFAKASKFFDIVKYTGDGTQSRYINHSLGTNVGLILIKAVNDTQWWVAGAADMPGNAALSTDMFGSPLSGATYDSSGFTTSNFRNGGGVQIQANTTNFRVGSHNAINAGTETSVDRVNKLNITYVAYVFATDQSSDSKIKCGTYFSTAGESVRKITTGWKPRFILVKSQEVSSWAIFDTQIGSFTAPAATTNPSFLFFGTTYSEAESYAAYSSTRIRVVHDGFELETNGTILNTSSSGTKLFYMAIKDESAPVNPTSGYEVFQPSVYTGNNTSRRELTTYINPDVVLIRQRTSTASAGFVMGIRNMGTANFFTGDAGTAQTSRLTNLNAPTTYYNGAGTTASFGNAFSVQNRIILNNNADVNTNTTGSNHICLAFAKKYGFMDSLFYTGTGTTQNIKHSLGVVPELIITKATTNLTEAFNVAILNPSQNYADVLSEIGQPQAVSGWFNATATTFSTSNLGNNTDLFYHAWLFASCPGVSKVGVYTGNGTDGRIIDCGFSNGARFILIKPLSGTGDWLFFDSARGIISGNDPRIDNNSLSAEVTSTDYVDPSSTGFIVNSTFSTTNTNGTPYFFLAIA